MAEQLNQSAGNQVTAGSNGPIIRLLDLYKSFGPLRVLAGIDLNIERGKTTVVLGPSGTGKSVLLKHIVGLLRPDRGQVWYQDQRVDRLSERELGSVRTQVGFLFQMGALFDSMSVGQNIGFPLVEHSTLTPPQIRERCLAMLSMVGLDEHMMTKMPASLSGGQRKRVALARAIVLEPKVVLYDEPTTGLDPVRADVINELILSLGRRLGITSIVVTHDMVSATKIADRMVMLYDGKIIADGPPGEFGKSTDPVVQQFIQGRADQEDLDAIHNGLTNESSRMG
ncbi:MAG: ABC transporter ATP-binding protein [Phycisphaeraceae bacterium]|nr:ABC transporter ATP-binding protein [Phycisphaeraceae bacterium]